MIRLRVLHPVLAVVIAACWRLALRLPVRPTTGGDARRCRRGRRRIVQVLAGFVNVLLLAPVWMQLVHLLLADALWIAFVMLPRARCAIWQKPSGVPAGRSVSTATA